MIPVVSLLTVVTLSMVVTRIAAVALVYTGLSHQAARFQARSAFTGVGFTTSEAEHLVNHPVRRTASSGRRLPTPRSTRATGSSSTGGRRG